MRNVEGAFFIGLLVVLLLGVAFFIPSNSITGNVIAQQCADASCAELCDVNAQENSCTVSGTVCCFTHWESGVCDYPQNCEVVREYSLYQSLELYRDTVRTPPPSVDPSWRSFFFPLLLTLGLITYFVVRKRRTHHF